MNQKLALKWPYTFSLFPPCFLPLSSLFSPDYYRRKQEEKQEIIWSYSRFAYGKKERNITETKVDGICLYYCFK
jgi:hypothetical protein